ncbi:hypothetical protein [Dankookia sp. P2]|uniref:hypothetical protein n=1 Tax=Dankookia sp. P2 TaxID=3423955 RepID=UPI003D670CA3
MVSKALAKVGEVNSRVVVFRALLDVFKVEAAKTVATMTGQVSVRGGQVRFRRARTPSALEKWETIPTLFLDADLDPEIIRRWWPGLRDEEVIDVTCGWSPHVRVVQVRGTSFSKTWAVGYGRDMAETKRVAKHQSDLNAFIRHAMAVNGAAISETMIITYKGTAEALGERFKDDDLYAVPEDPAAWRSVGWFNALAGMDRWKDVKVGFVVGRPQATPEQFSDLARSLWGHEDRDWADVEPDAQGFKKAPVKRYRVHTQDSAMPATTGAQLMPDERCDRVYRQITWGQSMQADGRIRPVHRTADKPCVLFVMGELPRGMQVDEVVYWDDVIVDRFDVAVARAVAGGGVVPSSAGGLAKFAPDLWKNAKAVEKDCRSQVDDDEVSVSLTDKLEGATRKLAALTGGKPPLHAIGLSHSTERGLSDKTSPPPDGPSGQLRLARVPGSPLSWLRVPSSAPAALSDALTAAFGPTISRVRVESGDWIAFADLRIAEAQYANAKLAEQLRRLNAETSRTIYGVEQDDDLPEPMTPRAKFRHRAGLGRVERARRRGNVAAIYRNTAEAVLWLLGEALAFESVAWVRK